MCLVLRLLLAAKPGWAAESHPCLVRVQKSLEVAGWG